MKSLVDADIAVTEETFDSLHADWLNPHIDLQWVPVFTTPVWLKVWWENFGSGKKPFLLGVRRRGRLVGVAPLMVETDVAVLMGDPDVCDYLDVVVADGEGPVFFDALIRFLKERHITRLEFGPIREDSITYEILRKTGERHGCDVRCGSEDVSYEMGLPKSWDDYLRLLNGKQRHEIRRKFRRLYESSSVQFQLATGQDREADALNVFLELFKRNRHDKAAFMTARMTAYFHSLARALQKEGMLKLFLLNIDDIYAAAVFCIDHGSTLYLYNNSYDDRFHAWSVGVLSKALTIEYAIKKGRNRYDFLKGDEAYKHRLGGRPVALYRCRMDLV